MLLGTHREIAIGDCCAHGLAYFGRCEPSPFVAVWFFSVTPKGLSRNSWRVNFKVLSYLWMETCNPRWLCCRQLSHTDVLFRGFVNGKNGRQFHSGLRGASKALLLTPGGIAERLDLMIITEDPLGIQSLLWSSQLVIFLITTGRGPGKIHAPQTRDYGKHPGYELNMRTLGLPEILLLTIPETEQVEKTQRNGEAKIIKIYCIPLFTYSNKILQIQKWWPSDPYISQHPYRHMSPNHL